MLVSSFSLTLPGRAKLNRHAMGKPVHFTGFMPDPLIIYIAAQLQTTHFLLTDGSDVRSSVTQQFYVLRKRGCSSKADRAKHSTEQS